MPRSGPEATRDRGRLPRRSPRLCESPSQAIRHSPRPRQQAEHLSEVEGVCRRSGHARKRSPLDNKAKAHLSQFPRSQAQLENEKTVAALVRAWLSAAASRRRLHLDLKHSILYSFYDGIDSCLNPPTHAETKELGTHSTNTYTHTQMAKYLLEYIWLDGYTPCPISAAKPLVKNLAAFPPWKSFRTGDSMAAPPVRLRDTVPIAC